MRIATPTEVRGDQRRVAQVEVTARLVKHGREVWVETGAVRAKGTSQ